MFELTDPQVEAIKQMTAINCGRYVTEPHRSSVIALQKKGVLLSFSQPWGYVPTYIFSDETLTDPTIRRIIMSEAAKHRRWWREKEKAEQVARRLSDAGHSAYPLHSYYWMVVINLDDEMKIILDVVRETAELSVRYSSTRGVATHIQHIETLKQNIAKMRAVAEETGYHVK